MRNVCWVAIVGGLLFASGCLSGCGGGNKIVMSPVGTEERDDARFGAALGSMDQVRNVGDFLKECSPAEKVKYINKTVEFGPVTMYKLKAVYQQFSTDPSAEVANAAKEALDKVPDEAGYKKAVDEQIEKLKTK